MSLIFQPLLVHEVQSCATLTCELVQNIGQTRAWTDKQLVEVLHRNWPDALKPINGIHGENIDAAVHKKLRNANINVAIRTNDGTTYGMMAVVIRRLG